MNMEHLAASVCGTIVAMVLMLAVFSFGYWWGKYESPTDDESPGGMASGVTVDGILARVFDIVKSDIDVLRSGEGESVTILCDNPEADANKRCSIEVIGSWTSWADRRFTGATWMQAVSRAAELKRKADEIPGRKHPTESCGMASGITPPPSLPLDPPEKRAL